MSSPFHDGATWADQWDEHPDPLLDERKNGNGGGGVGKKVEKTKEAALSGIKKVKQGTCLGFGWMKSKCRKDPQTHL